jgi:putative transcriptional regulator
MAYYHPSDDILMAFAAGQLADALGIQVACHIENCAQCRAKISTYERLGGELINELDNAKMSEGSLATLLTKIEQPYQEKTQAIADTRIPAPLRRFLPAYYDQLQWKGFSSSIKEFTLPISNQKYTAKFYKISAGKELPVHTHKGNEYTLVMEGRFSDKSGDYQAGDFILADTQTIHQPKAADDCDCICFAVMDAPLKMTGFFGRMLNPFL